MLCELCSKLAGAFPLVSYTFKAVLVVLQTCGGFPPYLPRFWGCF